LYATAAALLAASPAAIAHGPRGEFDEGYGLLARWAFEPTHVDATVIASTAGHATLRLSGDATIVRTETGAALLGEGMSGFGTVETPVDARRPTDALTVSAWALIERPTRWGGLVGRIQDNGDAEQGWLLGYTNDRFSFALASEGADDGNGLLTYLEADEPYARSTWHHVAATYDGTTMRLYVNGRLAATSDEQHGAILHPETAPYVVGAYHDANELYPLEGALQHVRVYDRCLDAAAIERMVAAAPSMAGAAAIEVPLRMLVAPYLQAATQTGMTVMFETNRPGRGTVEYGTALPLDRSATAEGPTGIYQIALTDLEPETSYFYRVRSEMPDGASVEAGPYTFKTAVRPDSAFAFVVMGDTQNNPTVTRLVAEQAWGHRPDFLVHCGDLVGTGEVKREWVYEFFGAAAPLLRRFPIFPALGNHERDARLYYDYFALPAPEYHYEFRYGNAHFFVLDTNKDVSEGTEQHRWLDDRLAASTARWKIVYHHQPAFTSDSNDYGDTYEGGSTQGDPMIQSALVPLYERHGVDVVFNGHIHVYERTWPLRAGRVDQDRGVVYVTTGGAGGGLEDFAPTRTWFAAHLYRGHHFCVVAVHDGTLSMKVYDVEGRLFDFMELHR
jgi:predicted phosphodiesterase